MRRLLGAVVTTVVLGVAGVFGLSAGAHAASPYPIVQTTSDTTPLYADAQLTVPAIYAPVWGMVFYHEGGTDAVWAVAGPVSRYPAKTYYARSSYFRVQGAVQYKVTPTCTPTALYRDKALTQVAYPNGLSSVASWGYLGGDATVSEVLPTLIVQELLPTSYYAKANCFARA